MTAHLPVLLHEFLSFFEGRKLKTFVDGTVGFGGHSKAILEAHPEIERLYACDQDETALALSKERLSPFLKKISFIHGNFRDLPSLINEKVDGIFLDIGVSSMQIDTPERGFSFMKEGPLDMRMDPTSELDAATIVNSYSEKDLATIFWEYGEERRSRIAAKAIVLGRRKKKIRTTLDLVELLEKEPPFQKRGKIHPLTLIFQALRIAVNDELGAIKMGVPACFSLLNEGGRLGVISFHSLEDRVVKEGFRTLSKEKEGKLLTKKPLIATREEIRVNPRSRSAKLRFIEKSHE